MNKFLSAIICSFFFFTAAGQSLTDIRDMVAGNRLAEARSAIIQFLETPGNDKNADAWYLKGYIFNIISKNRALSQTPDADKKEAFAAFKTCYAADPKNKWLATEEYASLYDLYNGFFELAAGRYRDNNFSGAFSMFCMADTIQQFLYHYQLKYKGFKFSKTDTTLLLNTAICAFRAKRDKEGAAYYARIADARIKDPAYLPVYHALVDHFIAIKDEIAFRKYLRIGRELFPYDQYWVQAEADLVKSRGLNDALVKNYEEQIARTPDNYTLNYNYSADLFNMIYTAETKPERPEQLKARLAKQLERTLALQTKGVMTELLCARYYYQEAHNVAEDMKTAPDDEKKALAASVHGHLEKARQYAAKVFTYYDGTEKLSRADVEGFKIAAEMLANICETNNQADKALEYRNKLQEIAKITPYRQTN
jgi:hypothetical protein